MNTHTFLTSQEIKDRLFLFNVTNDLSHLTNVHPLQQVNFMYPSVIFPMDVMLEKDPVIEKRKKIEYLTYLFKPSENAIKALPTEYIEFGHQQWNPVLTPVIPVTQKTTHIEQPANQYEATEQLNNTLSKFGKKSKLAVKAYGTVQEEGAVKDLQILSIDIVNESSN